MTDVKVTLDIMPGGGPANSSWVNVPASNGTLYGYRFGGGTNGKGDIEQPVGEQVVIYLQCIAQPEMRFQIGGDIMTNNDPENQLQGIIDHPLLARIFDRNDKPESNAEWSVPVIDTAITPSCTILCDPRVTNDPD